MRENKLPNRPNRQSLTICVGIFLIILFLIVYNLDEIRTVLMSKRFYKILVVVFLLGILVILLIILPYGQKVRLIRNAEQEDRVLSKYNKSLPKTYISRIEAKDYNRVGDKCTQEALRALEETPQFGRMMRTHNGGTYWGWNKISHVKQMSKGITLDLVHRGDDSDDQNI